MPQKVSPVLRLALSSRSEGALRKRLSQGKEKDGIGIRRRREHACRAEKSWISNDWARQSRGKLGHEFGTVCQASQHGKKVEENKNRRSPRKMGDAVRPEFWEGQKTSPQLFPLGGRRCGSGQQKGGLRGFIGRCAGEGTVVFSPIGHRAEALSARSGKERSCSLQREILITVLSRSDRWVEPVGFK